MGEIIMSKKNGKGKSEGGLGKVARVLIIVGVAVILFYIGLFLTR